jgi:hypothetical protein
MKRRSNFLSLSFSLFNSAFANFFLSPFLSLIGNHSNPIFMHLGIFQGDYLGMLLCAR